MGGLWSPPPRPVLETHGLLTRFSIPKSVIALDAIQRPRCPHHNIPQSPATEQSKNSMQTLINRATFVGHFNSTQHEVLSTNAARSVPSCNFTNCRRGCCLNVESGEHLKLSGIRKNLKTNVTDREQIYRFTSKCLNTIIPSNSLPAFTWILAKLWVPGGRVRAW